jgi:CHAD domain-containing protein
VVLLDKYTKGTQTDRHTLRRMAGVDVEIARSRLRQQLREFAWHERIRRIASAVEHDELLLQPTQPAAAEYRALLQACLSETAHALRRRPQSVDALHRQRIRIKHARYVSELLTPRVEVNLRSTLAALGAAQDLLGEVHDLQALCDWLPSTGCGRLAERLSKIATKRAERLSKQYQPLQLTLRKKLQAAAHALQPL